jgi:hypothetical protein
MKYKPIMLIVTVLILMAGFNSMAVLHVAKPDENPVAPYRGILYTANEINQVREIALNDHAMRKIAGKFLASAKTWANRSDTEIDALIPPVDAVYAYGYAGDPRTDGAWPWFARAKKMCSVDRPYEVRSPHTGDVYAIQKPGEKYYDPGDGWVRPSDSKRFYFKGVWHSYVIDELHKAIDDMAIAYMLTGNEKVAEKALRIFDQLATLRPRLVCDNGCIDLNHPGKGYGAFRYSGNIANKRMASSVYALDLLGRSKAALAPSHDNAKITIFENIRQNYFFTAERRGKTFETNSLQNHALAMFNNIIAQAVMFGDPDDLKYGIEAIYAFLNNCVDRDGEYYEVSGSYNNTGRKYVERMISALRNYDPKNYENSERYPDPKDYPCNMNFGNDPRWYSVAVDSTYKLEVLGRDPGYGDSTYDQNIFLDETNMRLHRKRAYFLKHFYFLTEDSALKEKCANLFWQLPETTVSKQSLEDFSRGGMSQWLKPSKPESSNNQTLKSVLMPGKIISVLRSGKDAQKRAMFMRGGIPNSHGHDDQMAIILYAKGMCITGEYGYKVFGRPDYLGFGTRSISHKTVVVDEDKPTSRFAVKLNKNKYLDMFKPRPAADVLGFGTASPAQFVEMSNPRLWENGNVKEYRRLVWMIDVSDTDFYFIDFFRIDGGQTHDYAWNGPFLEQPEAEDGFSLDGVTPKPVDGVWTLAALSGSNRDATFNKPGQSWGERLVGNSGVIKDLGIPGEKIGWFHWNPPPKNGYGFIYNVKAAETTNDWSGKWKLIDKTSYMQTTMLNPDGQTVITAKSPTLQMGRHHNVAIARRTSKEGRPLKSRFVSLTQVSEKERWPVKNQRWAKVTTDGGPQDVAAVEIELADGRKDLVLTSTKSTTLIKNGDVKLAGTRGFVRRDISGRVTDLILSSGTELTAGDCSIKLARDAWKATVTQVEAGLQNNRVTIDKELPSGTRLAGHTALFASSSQSKYPYSHNEYYRIEKIGSAAKNKSVIDFGVQSLIGGRVIVKEVNANGLVKLKWPNQLSSYKGTRPFDGHQIVVTNGPGRKTTLVTYEAKREFIVDNPDQLKIGDQAEIRVIQPGDLLEVPALAILKKTAENSWTLHTNQDLELTLPAPDNTKLIMINSNGKEITLAKSKKGRVQAKLSLSAMPEGILNLMVR